MNELNSKRNLAYLYDLQTQNKSQQLSDSEFFDAVGETFRLNPDFFMKELYNAFINKMGKILGAEKRKEMERYVIEKFCLLEDEQILYELKGNIKQTELLEQKPSGKYKMDNLPLKISVNTADIFITNYRIIAHGVLKASGGQSKKWGALFWLTGVTILWDLRDLGVTGGARSKRAEGKEAIIESSPVFGYQFPIKNHTGLVKLNPITSIAYNITIDNRKCMISIKPSDPLKRFEHMSKIFDILRKDANEVLGVINEVYETEVLEKYKRRSILSILKGLRKSEEYQDISDSEYLDIVRETYKLDPEFFLKSIFPKMKTWNFPSFLSIKDELFELIENLNKETEQRIS